MSENTCCPQCGSTVTYMGLRTVECTGTDCENNPGKGKFDWSKFFMQELRHNNIGHVHQWTATQSKAKPPDPAKLKAFLDAQKKRLTTTVVPDSDPDSDLVLQFLRTPVNFQAETMVVWPSPKSYKKLADIRYTCKKNRDVP